MCRGILPGRIIPILCRYTHARRLDVLACSKTRVVARGSRSPCMLGRTFLGGVTIQRAGSFLASVALPMTGYLVMKSTSGLVPLRTRLYLQLRNHVGIFHSRPCFLRLIPRNVSGTLSLTILLGRVKMTHRRIVTVNSKCGSLSVVEFTKLKVTVKGTRRPMGGTTSCVALDGRRSNMTRTVGGFYGRR